jgi:hypothetical protein
MAYPLALPTGPLGRLAPSGTPEQAAMAECLSDGPPQHALANAAMMWLLGTALDRVEEHGPVSSRASARTRARSPSPAKPPSSKR